MAPRPSAIDTTPYLHPLISERAIDDARPLRVIYVGAGISGIIAAILLPKYVPNAELTIYEKNPEIGGTWFENRYPGCACDIPAHTYQLSFESNPDWSQFYATAPEIFSYWQRVVDKYNVRRYMKFRHRCKEARWNEETSKWHVAFDVLDESGHVLETHVDVGDVLMTGMGALNEWKWPDIPGLKTFKGKVLHSADYDQTFKMTGKKIAVIGAGSSGIQIVPTLQPQVSHMDHYVRGRTWISATFGHELVEARKGEGNDGNFTYTAEEIENWRKDPASYLAYRKALEVGVQSGYAVVYRNTKEHNGARILFEQRMRERLAKDPKILDHLLPDFPPLCKRLTPGPGYLEALTSSNVTVVPDGISHVTETGITAADGTHRPVDAIVCATGFDTSFRGRFPIYGRNGLNLQDRYRDRPETYLSMTTDNYPNYFMSLGPNAGRGNGNLLVTIEAIHHYVGQILQKLSTGNVKSVEVRPDPVQNFTNYCDAYFKRTVFSAECNSWYKTVPPGVDPAEKKRGRISALWPGSNIHQLKALEKVRWEDYVLTTADENEFGWFGDGWSVAEREGDEEGMSWYLNGTRMLHQPLHDSDEVGINDLNGLGMHGVSVNGSGSAEVDGQTRKIEIDRENLVEHGMPTA